VGFRVRRSHATSASLTIQLPASHRSEEAVRLIIGEGVKVDAAALMVGLRSRKNLYALVKRTTGLQLSDIRKTARPTNSNGNVHLNGSERRMQH
jgi:methylphosphotriester-DNA--protein-cysteine methyltransferase